jgi:hypothetical protein
MVRTRLPSTVVIAVALTSLFALFHGDPAATAEPPKPTVDTPDGEDMVAAQIKELQKQVAELQDRIGQLQKVRVVAAGTATWIRPGVLANRTSVHVTLAADVTAQLGKDYVVILTSRFPQGGYPYLAPYWTPGSGGFDITLVDTALGNGESAEYAGANKNYLVDWIVVKK